MEKYINSLGENAKAVAASLSILSTNEKNNALAAMAKALRSRSEEILTANAEDMAKGKENNLNSSLLDRLLLTEARIESMALGLEDLIPLKDPIGATIEQWKQPNGLEIARKRVPLGVIAMIYEARPNVTVDAAGLAFKTGNALILKGGKEAFSSNLCLANILRDTLKELGLPVDAIQFVERTEREAVGYLLKLRQYIDVVIPRGGGGLIQFVVNNSAIPAIETGVGNCHIYIDKDANLTNGAAIVFNAKTQRPAVCNAMETLLVHKDIAAEFFPLLLEKLKEKPVEIRGCSRTCALVKEAHPCTEQDWETEFLDLIMAVRIVDSLDDAMEHIRKYTSGHSEAIITENYTAAETFLNTIDAAAVYVNASTRFTDGNEFGFGAEIGISTQKLHARGPMGLNALTSEKFVIRGNGQVRK